ncbi:hypothetical protein KQ41_06670 [Lysinibacillus fusiformis]|uniref:hypothetical protein n=1 Tax=Lysinibacillus fusiformis TaxID=28031 RepID=UPI0005056748|nr:hypothetical protein [Lysinibacillus fusiformis]KGA83718.1 hypothetical protein KQ41_06670 [Lysinibacillus fusiformis]
MKEFLFNTELAKIVVAEQCERFYRGRRDVEMGKSVVILYFIFGLLLISFGISTFFKQSIFPTSILLWILLFVIIMSILGYFLEKNKEK